MTIYAKSYCDNLSPIFGAAVKNGTDIQTDYFEKDAVRLFPGDALYEAALARAEGRA